MLGLFIKSTLVGFVTLVIGGLAGVFLFMVRLWIYAAYFFKSPVQSGGSEQIQVGWDVITIFENYKFAVLLFLFLAFAVGFILSFQRFAKSNG